MKGLMDPVAWMEDGLWDINERRGPWSHEGSMPQCRGMPGPGSRSGWVDEQGKEGWDRDFLRGNEERG